MKMYSNTNAEKRKAIDEHVLVFSTLHLCLNVLCGVLVSASWLTVSPDKKKYSFEVD